MLIQSYYCLSQLGGKKSLFGDKAVVEEKAHIDRQQHDDAGKSRPADKQVVVRRYKQYADSHHSVESAVHYGQNHHRARFLSEIQQYRCKQETHQNHHEHPCHVMVGVVVAVEDKREMPQTPYHADNHCRGEQLLAFQLLDEETAPRYLFAESENGVDGYA